MSVPHPIHWRLQKHLWGLLKGELYSQENVIIEEVEGKGRSAAGEFVCEYRGVVCRKQGEDGTNAMPPWVLDAIV